MSQDENIENTIKTKISTGSVGTVTLNEDVYNHFSLYPEISIGKVNIGLDLYLYFNNDGIYTKNWDFSDANSSYKSIIDKIYFLEWGKNSDNFYFRVGSLPSITLGEGILLQNYSNIMQYPQIRKTGLNLKAKISDIYIEFIHSNLKVLEPSIIGLRVSYLLYPKLNMGFTYVTDMDQNMGLTQINNTITTSVVDPISGIALDFVYTISEKVVFYSQFSKLIGEISNEELGSGFVPFGMKSKWDFLDLFVEYRISSKRFIFSYWDRSYDLDRVVVDSENSYYTKESQLDQYGNMSGIYFHSEIHIMNMFDWSISYQNMQGDKKMNKQLESNKSNQNFMTAIKINTSLLPRLNRAEIFYQQNNIENPFKFVPNSSTILGYNIGFEISPEVELFYKGRTTYTMDTITDSFKPNNSIQVETKFTF
tara:strand:+ start:1456 stop:2721 length:1266 start_codon:yes stop_codon:yes gene_type:complete